MTNQHQPTPQPYTACYEAVADTLEACEGGIVDYNIEEIADEAIVPHPSGSGWMIVGADDPIDMGETFWTLVEKHTYPDDHHQDMARVLANYGDWAIGSEQARTVATEWQEALPNITPDELRDWLAAGVWTAKAAKELTRAGIDPTNLPYPTGYAYTNGDLEIMHVREELANNN